MKKAFGVLKNRPRIVVVLTRDPVCDGDDDASHEERIELYSYLDPAALARSAAARYLPAMPGGGHRWTCLLNDRPIAEITTTGIQSLTAEVEFDEENRIHFEYRVEAAG